MIDPIETEMLKARVKLLIEQPMFGQIIMHLEMQDASDWCDTAATDGRKFYYNREFIKSLTLDELVFLHGHEVLHVVLEHMFRHGNRNQKLWNIAADFLINYILVKSNVGTMPKSGLLNDNYTDEFSTDELYMLLERTMVDVTHMHTLDMHLDMTGSREADAGKTLLAGAPPTMSPEEIEDVRETMRSVLLQAAQNTPPGKVPAGIRRLLDQLLKPKINWRQILVSVMRSAIKYDYTYTRMSRRSWNSGIILPGQDVMDRVTATAFLDGSGSTTQAMVTSFLSECQGIMRTFRDFELTIGTFDTEVYNVKVFTPNNANEISQYAFLGSGGTIPTCCWEYMKAHELRPHRLLIFTDGEIGSGDWGDPNYCETIFIIHSNLKITAPYGRTIHYEA
jgi:predicted metal-dependent peptidase